MYTQKFQDSSHFEILEIDITSVYTKNVWITNIARIVKSEEF